MSYHNDGPPAGCIIGLLLVLFLALVIAGPIALLKYDREQAILHSTPPDAATVATVSTGAGALSLEVSGHYVVETVQTNSYLSEAQSALVTWLAAHPDLRLVEVIPITSVGGGGGGTNGFVIVAEAQVPGEK